MADSSRRRSNTSKSELTDEQVNSIHEAFAVFDAEQTGKMETKNLKVSETSTSMLMPTVAHLFDFCRWP